MSPVTLLPATPSSPTRALARTLTEVEGGSPRPATSRTGPVGEVLRSGGWALATARVLFSRDVDPGIRERAGRPAAAGQRSGQTDGSVGRSD